MTGSGDHEEKRLEKWLKRSEKGQSLVEFTASVVVLMIIVGGVLDIGRAYMIFVALENGAGEGAIFASYHPTWVTQTDAAAGGSSYPATENITYRATHESPTGHRWTGRSQPSRLPIHRATHRPCRPANISPCPSPIRTP